MPEPSVKSPVGTPFIELSSVDSTNNYALTQLRAGLAHHGAAFFAHEQFAGRGQRGKTWAAEKDSSLILSVVIDPGPLSLNRQFELSAMVALATAEFLLHYAVNDITIKWPNDLYWRDRKAGGILIENIIGAGQGAERPGDWQWAVAGIGINLNQAAFPPDLKNPVSLRQITGKSHDPVKLAKELCESLDRRYTELVTDGFDKIYQEYLSLLYKKDQVARLKKGTRVFDGLIKRVTTTGELEVEHGIRESFQFGEIEWILQSPDDKIL